MKRIPLFTMWSTVFFIYFVLTFAVIEMPVESFEMWEDYHHKTAFSEILSNPITELSWRYNVDSEDMGSAFGASNMVVVRNSTLETIRSKRYADGSTFRGKPKTREERWHQNFNMNATNLKLDQAISLVTLLNKITERYMADCVPIIFYDRMVEYLDDIILQIFFQVNYMNIYFGFHQILTINV